LPRIATLLAVFALAASPAVAAQKRHVVFTYDVVVHDIPASAKVIDLWIPTPPETEGQEVLSLSVAAATNGAFLKERTYGNRVWHGRFDRPADGTIRATLTVELIRSDRTGLLADQPQSHGPHIPTRRFLQASRLVPLTRRFSQIAEKAIGANPTPIAQARALYNYVLNRMTYDKSGQRWGRGDAVYACDVGKGNCSDFHSLFIALSRSAGIPSRFWIGFPLPPERGRSEISGYHCWAEFYVAGTGWVPVDISEADKHPQKQEYFFGNLDENRIAFTLGRDLVLPPAQEGPPLNFFIYPYAEVDGQPWDNINRHFTVEDKP